MQIDQGFTNISETLNDRLKSRKKGATYQWQEICVEIANLSGVPKGVAFKLWKKVGWDVSRILSEIKQGEIKNSQKYIYWLLKN